MKRKAYKFENAVPCDASAPLPCENHTSNCDMWYGTCCDWQNCPDYLTRDDIDAANDYHCECCLRSATCKKRGDDSLFCPDFVQ